MGIDNQGLLLKSGHSWKTSAYVYTASIVKALTMSLFLCLVVKDWLITVILVLTENSDKSVVSPDTLQTVSSIVRIVSEVNVWFV